MSNAEQLEVWLSFKDLRDANIVKNWETLGEWQRLLNFPAGRLLGPNTRRWTKTEIDEWLASRPATRSQLEDA